MGAILFGGFFVFVGIALVVQEVVVVIGRVRGNRDTRYGDALRNSSLGAVVAAFGYTIIHYRGAELTLTPTAVRVAFAVCGALVVATAVLISILAPKLREQEEGDDPAFGRELVSEGPAEALMSWVWRALGFRLSAVVLAGVGVIIGSGALWPDVPKQVMASWLVFVDVLELVGYGLLTLLCAAMILTGIRTRTYDDLATGTFFLVLWGMGIVVGLVFGLLDGWIDILNWIYDLVA